MIDTAGAWNGGSIWATEALGVALSVGRRANEGERGDVSEVGSPRWMNATLSQGMRTDEETRKEEQEGKVMRAPLIIEQEASQTCMLRSARWMVTRH